MNIEKPCGISGSFCALRHHRNDFLLLLRSELWTTPSDSTLLTGSIQSSHCSFAKYCPFELGKCSYHLHHHTARSSSRIYRLRQTPESGFSIANPFHNRQDVTERAREPIETPDHEYIPLPQLIQ